MRDIEALLEPSPNLGAANKSMGWLDRLKSEPGPRHDHARPTQSAAMSSAPTGSIGSGSGVSIRNSSAHAAG